MLIRAKRLFISTIYGNVSAGKILEASEAHGQHLIHHGLAEEYKPETATPGQEQKADLGKTQEQTQPGPIQSTPEKTPGPSSQAAPALQPKTAKKSARGVRKARKEKSQS